MARAFVTVLPFGPLLAVVVGGSAAACVPIAKYDALAESTTVQKKSDDERIHALQSDLDAAKSATQARDAKLAELDTVRHNVQAALDESTAMNEQLRAELTHLGRDVDSILKERGSLAKALDDAKLRLEELRRAQTAAEAHAALFRDIASRFGPLLDGGQIRVTSRRGRLSMLVAERLLFVPLRAEIAPGGEKVLQDLARAIRASAPDGSGRRFVVNAHVEDTPKSNRPGASYELGAQRAIAAVERLVALGVRPEQLIVATSGAFDPVTTTPDVDAAIGRNVLEISLQPSADDAVSVQETK